MSVLPFFYFLFISKVEKNDDIDQKIEQDGIKPEDKAHKAAIKIQASFRGHITRKKLKGEKKGDTPTIDVEGGEKKEEVLANGLADGKTAITEIAPTENALPGGESKGENTPADEKQADGVVNSGSEQPVPKATTPSTPLEEKSAPAATESATKASTDNSPSLKADEAQVKEEPKQADVPATAISPSAAEDATAKATAQPQTDTAVSSQNEEKTGQHDAFLPTPF
uniref:Neuromodulin n=1 Tax=Laticauda laticaudata TaxID=8630 RepID=A0A8C5SEJ4_LATLA